MFLEKLPLPFKGEESFLVILDIIFKFVDFFLCYPFKSTGELLPILKIEKQIVFFVLKFL